MRGLSLVLAAVFALAAGLQFNDPDPWLWSGAYLGAAILSLLAWREALSAKLAALAGLGFGLPALYWLPALLNAPASAFGAWEMDGAAAEEAREAGGLLLCAVWSGALWWRERRMGISDAR